FRLCLQQLTAQGDFHYRTRAVLLVLTLRTAEATISNRSSTICSGRASVVGPSEEPVDAGRRATSSSRHAGASAQTWPQQLRLKEPARKDRQDDWRETDHRAIDH